LAQLRALPGAVSLMMRDITDAIRLTAEPPRTLLTGCVMRTLLLLLAIRSFRET
jgi:hypothetical protein